MYRASSATDPPCPADSAPPLPEPWHPFDEPRMITQDDEQRRESNERGEAETDRGSRALATRESSHPQNTSIVPETKPSLPPRLSLTTVDPLGDLSTTFTVKMDLPPLPAPEASPSHANSATRPTSAILLPRHDIDALLSVSGSPSDVVDTPALTRSMSPSRTPSSTFARLRAIDVDDVMSTGDVGTTPFPSPDVWSPDQGGHISGSGSAVRPTIPELAFPSPLHLSPRTPGAHSPSRTHARSAPPRPIFSASGSTATTQEFLSTSFRDPESRDFDDVIGEVERQTRVGKARNGRLKTTAEKHWSVGATGRGQVRKITLRGSKRKSAQRDMQGNWRDHVEMWTPTDEVAAGQEWAGAPNYEEDQDRDTSGVSGHNHRHQEDLEFESESMYDSSLDASDGYTSSLYGKPTLTVNTSQSRGVIPYNPITGELGGIGRTLGEIVGWSTGSKDVDLTRGTGNLSRIEGLSSDHPSVSAGHLRQMDPVIGGLQSDFEKHGVSDGRTMVKPAVHDSANDHVILAPKRSRINHAAPSMVAAVWLWLVSLLVFLARWGAAGVVIGTGYELGRNGIKWVLGVDTEGSTGAGAAWTWAGNRTTASLEL
ncbi:hypothetical protein HDU93_007821 [Gonapodya sp. JEL0774]|nr:hypothetical protein HDU93_007821 [Gonapodya sp. JEL0774]